MVCAEMLDVGEKDVVAAGLGAGIADEAQWLHGHLARARVTKKTPPSPSDFIQA